MAAQSRFLAVVFAGVAMTGLVFAQGAPAPAAGQAPAPAPAGQTPAAPAAPAAGRGGRGGRGGAAPAAGQAAPARRGGFTQFTRPVASPEVVAHGKTLYEANCASCHASDLRGGTGTNLLRSANSLSDKKGELILAKVSAHNPKINLSDADVTDVAEYIHSVLATSGGQGSPPGRNPTGLNLNVLVGDAAAGQTDFQNLCSSCHSVTGDLKGIGGKYTDARELQNAWVAGTGGAFAGGGGGGRGGGGGGRDATLTMPDGSKVQGTLVRQDDFLIIMTLPDGTRKSMARTPGMTVDVVDAQAAHKAMALKLDDPENKKMHDVTAYLATVK